MARTIAEVAEAAKRIEGEAICPDEPQEPGAKRKRASRLEVAIKAVAVHQDALEKAQAKMLKVQSSSGIARNTTAQKKLDGVVAKVAKFSRLRQDAEAKVEKLKEEALLAAEAVEAKKASAEDKAESSKNLSEAALMLLVEVRLKFQKKFDNSSDTAVNIWPHVHAEYIKKITDNTLPESDRISSAQLQRRWGLELGKFRMWCAVANRAINQSGVSRDSVEDEVSDIDPDPNHP